MFTGKKLLACDIITNGPKTFICMISLQILSKRIHYGKFVAEAKFRENPSTYETAIREQVLLCCNATLFIHYLYVLLS